MSPQWELPMGAIRGFRPVGTVLYVVSSNTLYSISATGTQTNLGVLSSSSGYVGMTDNGVQLGIADGNHLYCYTIVTGSYTQAGLNASGSFGVVADANYPAGAKTLDFINGNVIAESPGSRNYFCSIKYDLTGWTSASGLPIYAGKDDAADQIQAVSVINGIIVLLGYSTTEFWQNVGSSPLPFARITGTTKQWGLIAVRSLAMVMNAEGNGSLYFLARTLNGGRKVVKVDGTNISPVSTEDIDNLLKKFTTVNDAVALSYAVDGHFFYQLTFPAAGRSFLYDATTNFWSEAQTGVAEQAPHVARLGVVFNEQNYVCDSSTGKIYRLDLDVYTDNGTPIKRQVTSRHLQENGNEFSLDELWLDLETGVGLQSGQGSTPQIILRVSRDGGRVFGKENWVSFGKVGQYESPRAVWRRLGSALDMVLEFTMTDPVKFTLIGAYADIEMEA